MTDFPVHAVEDAPEASRDSMQAFEQAFGFLPNVVAVMAGSPSLLNGLAALFQQVHTGRFDEPRIQAVLLTNAVTNRAAYAVAMHSLLAASSGVTAADIARMRGGRNPEDLRLLPLSRMARALIVGRGAVGPTHVAEFLASGYDPQDLLEVIAVVGASTLTNYAANVADPPPEPQLEPFAWVG